MTDRTLYARPARVAGRAALAALVALVMAGCRNVLKVSEPDIVTPSSLTGPAGLDALYTGAIGDFALAYAGGTGNGSFGDGVVTAGALMSDEAYLSGTFPTRTEFDQRSIDPSSNGTLRGMFHRLERARVSTQNAAAALQAAAKTAGKSDSRVGELLALAGYSYVAFAETYCSGVPFSTATPSGTIEYGKPQTTAEMLTMAIDTFDAALANDAGDATVADLATVGKARAQLDAGDFAAAGATAASVPTDYVYELYASVNGSVNTGTEGTFSLENGFYSGNTAERRLSISNNEGGVGLDFRTANDPRLTWSQDPTGGFDSTSPQYDFLAYAITGVKLGREASTPLATGVEARLIEAEAQLQNGDTAGMLATLNALRATVPGLAPLTDPGSDSARVSMLFRERAFWLYATGHRLGDLRRLVRQYNRSASSVYPSGAYFKGGDYGTDLDYPVPGAEQNNPNFTSCSTSGA